MKSWEDFLTNYDEAQPNVKVSWGPDRQPAKPKDKRQQRADNMEKLLGGIGSKPPAVKPDDAKDLEIIRKLEAVIANKGATEHEKAAAQAAISRKKNK